MKFDKIIDLYSKTVKNIENNTKILEKVKTIYDTLIKENNKKQLDGNHEKRKKPVRTPDGEFDSVRAAAVFYGKHETTIKSRFDKKWPGYEYIEKEN